MHILFSHLGNIDDDTLFTYGADTEVYTSCAATWNNEFWVIGGYNIRRQVNFCMLAMFSLNILVLVE